MFPYSSLLHNSLPILVQHSLQQRSITHLPTVFRFSVQRLSTHHTPSLVSPHHTLCSPGTLNSKQDTPIQQETTSIFSDQSTHLTLHTKSCHVIPLVSKYSFSPCLIMSFPISIVFESVSYPIN